MKNLILTYTAKQVSLAWYALVSGPTEWMRDLKEGSAFWGGDDEEEVVVLWKGDALLALVCVPECERGIGDDDGWDRSEDPFGELRGWKYLGAPPKEIQELYLKGISRLRFSYATAGLWGMGEAFNVPGDW